MLKTKSKTPFCICCLNGFRFSILIDPNATITQCKQLIHETIFILPERQRLIFAGKLLENDKTIQSYKIQKESCIHLVVEDEKEYWKNHI